MDEPSIDLQRDATTNDPGNLFVRIDPSLEFSSRNSGQETTYVALDKRTGKFYRFGISEYHIVTLMDGSRSLAEIHLRLQRDGLLWSFVDVVAFVRELTQHQLAAIVPAVTASNAADPRPEMQIAAQTGPGGSPGQGSGDPTPERRTWPATVLRAMNGLLTQRFPLADGDRVAAKLLPLLGPLFSIPAVAMWLILVGCGIGVVWSNADAFSAEVRRVFDQQLWLLLALLWCVLKIVHECGHAVCAKRHGVRVGPMGIMFFLFAPLAYVDVTNAWKLVRRRDRVQIALAGVYVELAIGATAALIWWCCPVGFSKHIAAQIFLVAGPATLLVNANPLLRLDGYYVVSDSLEIPNLRAHGRKQQGALIEAILFQLPMPPSQLTGWRKNFAVLHALCSVVFQVVWMSGLIVAISTWARGFGLVVAVIAAAMWGIIPLLRWMHRIWTMQPSRGWMLNDLQRRLIAVCALTCVVVEYAAVNTSPFARRVPVVVQFQNEQIARAPVDAFVAAVYVNCGDRVRRGTLLMELDQPDLVLKRDQLIDQRDVELAKAIQYRQRSEIAMSKVAERNAEGLERKLQEVSEQIDSMRIVAQRDGKITTPGTNLLLGSYVARGTELLRVSDPQEKEVLAIIAEDSLEAYRKAAAVKLQADIRLRGGVTIQAPLQNLQPSASRTLPHPALAVTSGGPLAVQMLQQSDSRELVYPQLRAVLPLDALTSLSVRSGQIGRLTIPDDRTMISRLWDQVQPR